MMVAAAASAAPAITMLPAAKIFHPEQITVRAALDSSTLDALLEAIADGVELPPAIVYHDGHRHWLVDGRHCSEARKKSGQSFLPVRIVQGTREEAILAALEKHREQTGTPWKSNDRRHAALLLLADPEMGRWSDREIAHRVGYACHKRVSALRALMKAPRLHNPAQEDDCEEDVGVHTPTSDGKSDTPATPSAPPSWNDAPEEAPRETRTVQPKDRAAYERKVSPKKDLPSRKDDSENGRLALKGLMKAERCFQDVGCLDSKDPESGLSYGVMLEALKAEAQRLIQV